MKVYKNKIYVYSDMSERFRTSQQQYILRLLNAVAWPRTGLGHA